MKKIITPIIIALLLMGIVSAYGAYPTVSINLPASNARTTAQITMNATIPVVTEIHDNQTLHNCTWYVYSSSTANSSSAIVMATNSSINISGADGIPFVVHHFLNTSSFEDATDYNFKVICHALNDTSRTSTDTETGIDIDNTIPVIPTSLTSTTQTAKDFTLTATVTGTKTTSCTVEWENQVMPSATTPTVSHSGDTCTISVTNSKAGVYNYWVTASDGTNTTKSGSARFISKYGGTRLPLAITAEPSEEGIPSVAAEGTLANELTTGEVVKTGAGAVLGGIVGTFVLPVIGTAIGVIIGGIIGAIL